MNNSNTIKIIVAVVIIGGIGLFAVVSNRNNQPNSINSISQSNKISPTTSQTDATGIKIGDAAPDFTVTDVNGKTFSLSSESKPMAIFFFAGWCGLCVPEARAWMTLSKENPGKFIPVIIDIQRGETNEDVKRFMQSVVLNSPEAIWALDTDDLLTKYNVKRLDTTFILDSNKKILYKDEFPTDEDTLREQLR
ncbi:MAG: redoxin domain-containing protein, partial [Nitrospirae bacterium]